jgi:hypothetical protein
VDTNVSAFFIEEERPLLESQLMEFVNKLELEYKLVERFMMNEAIAQSEKEKAVAIAASTERLDRLLQEARKEEA